MRFLSRGRRNAIRLTIGLGALAAFPAVGAGMAQAAGIGNALHPVFNQRPVLDHVNVLNGVNTGRAQFCFDKTVSLPNPGNPAAFRLGGYRWDTFLSGATGTQAVLDASAKCAIVTMIPGGTAPQQFSRDLYAYTIGTADDGTVTANQSGGSVNRADSAPNVDSVTKNGTRGHTSGSDLQSAITGSPAGTNEIIYLMDQPIDPTTVNPNQFRYYDQSGGIHFGVGAQVQNDPNGGQSAVRVQFALPSGQTTQDAAVIYTYRNNPPNGTTAAGQDNAPEPATYTTVQSVDNPACAASGCTTVRPKLISNEIAGTNTIDYTFDQAVSNVGPTSFYAVSSNGDETRSTTATVLTSNPKVVRATFSGGGGTNIANYTETIVQAWADDSAVSSSNGTRNFAEGKPAGDNANGRAPGYVNGPDATRLTLFRGTGEATVQFDQRVNSNAAGQPVGPDNATTTPNGDWIFLDGNGNPVARPTSATVEHVSAYIDQVRLGGINPVLIDQGVVKALEIVGNQVCSTRSGAARAACGAASGDPYVGGYTGFSTEPTAPAAQTAAVFTSGTAHVNNESGMNPAGNVQQILAPNSTAAIVLKKSHWVTVKTHKHGKHHTKAIKRHKKH